MTNHAHRAARFLKNEERAAWHDKTLWMVRKKRDLMALDVPDWEELREQASQIKRHSLSKLDDYLVQFEEQAINNGAQVHWASTAGKLNEIVYQIIKENNASRIVKSKSMLTEECGLNPFLEKRGIEIIDTDLGERIIQLKREPPSHIVMPAIHIKKEEISELFHRELNSEEGNTDPTYLAATARLHLRQKFIEAEVAITGVNFAVAENGAVVVCTNEGNADMGVHAAPIQIHCMGIEKVIPRLSDLAVFTRLLARSATGQPITTYTSHYLNPKPGGQMHIIIVDNGRSELIGKEDYRDSLKCIRCGACMNTCPVYRRSGGHSYHYVIPGPIGSILAPHSNSKEYEDLPFASSLCGSCSDVCPVKIDIHGQLYRWRQDLSQQGARSPIKKGIMKVSGKILASDKMYDWSGKAARWCIKYLPRVLIYNRLNTWGRERELPEVPRESFKEWYNKNFREGDKNGQK
ncbi:lactate utilization protein B [Proteiniphilum sp. UBA5480]|jgi:L-lactate dehydrogenase complex protein LldF|uniref:lactate utilization protein B n=1 Tax=Proteiniphilum sp. UBA5480 TaxID=1947282 RepID=UPI00257FD5EA|nr:lactate utilization protein B [Proteiniphilum sp. UBA5480]